MSAINPRRHRQELTRLAIEAMSERGLAPHFSIDAQKQVDAFTGPAQDPDPGIRDLRALTWCSIDNDDSRDLDQLTVCEPLADGAVRVLVAVADVDGLVKKDSPIDAHARLNTTSVYTSALVFPMLPERLSTDLTSLNPHADRLAIVTDMVIGADAAIVHAEVYRGLVRNQAQLAYDAVSAWLLGQGPWPAAAQANPALAADIAQQLRRQDEVAQALRLRRHAQGSLELETFQPRAQFEGDRVVGLSQQAHNRARQLIEEFMIAANTCTAAFLASHGGASLRRVVRSPERWQRLVALARQHGGALPPEPDARALEAFLARQHRTDPLRFPDLSLVVVKLMGAGEYVVEHAGQAPIGHFGLALRDYTHATAPNRRYPDLVTLRMIKSLLQGQPLPYSTAELQALAVHCTHQEDAARKVERRVRKSEAALYLAGRIGEVFDAIVTGRTDSGTWVRLLNPPAEGMLVGQVPLLEVGQTLRVKLTDTNVERGFIDFMAVH